MYNERRTKLLPRRLVVMCMAALSACAGVTNASEDVFDSATVNAIGDKVADWQIANLDDLSYIRSNRFGYNNGNRDSTARADRRGWQHGALYVGMLNWAALPGNEK